jgi:pimeloyl-ACP methyl ester carboxylesterase
LRSANRMPRCNLATLSFDLRECDGYRPVHGCQRALRLGPIEPVLTDGAVGGQRIAYVQSRSAHDFMNHHFGKHRPPDVSGALASNPGFDVDQRFVSIYVTALDGLSLHVRKYGAHVVSALPVVCLPGLARTAADFHPLATALAADPANPRLVLALDYRGHGQSQYDRNPNNYSIRVTLADLSTVLAAFQITSVIFIGTSFGGILAMMVAVMPPVAIAGVILNDIGPVMEPRGLMRIKTYVGKLPTARNFEEGAEILRWLFKAQFTNLTPQDWIAFAQRTWRECRGTLVPSHDPKLGRALRGLSLERLPILWDQFNALARIPLMVIRGANSDMLAKPTLNEMLVRRDQLEVVVVPDQGHAPLLFEPKVIRRIAAFIASCDRPARD